MSAEEQEPIKDPKVTPEPEEPTTPKKEKNISKTQQVHDKIISKLDNENFQLIDKNSKLELNKVIRDELHLEKGWSSDINKAIQKIAEDRKMKITDLGFKNKKVGGVTVNLVESENSSEPKEPEVKSNVSQSPMNNMPTGTGQNPHGALPKGSDNTTETERQEEPEKKLMSEDAQAKLIKKGLNDIIAPLYVSLGIVEPDEEEKQEEAKLPTAKKFKKDMDDLGDDINEYLKENNIRLPSLLNHLAIFLSIFMVLVLPVIKFKFFSSKQEPEPEYDESADNIEVKI